MKIVLGFAVAVCSAFAGLAGHVRVIDGPVMAAEEGLLLGNGDLSVSAYQNADGIVFRFGKGDVWDRRLMTNDCMRPATIAEFRNGILNEGWQCYPFDGKGTIATKGTKDEKRMRELCNDGVTPNKNWPYPCPKPTGELHMRLPTDIAGYMRTTQKLFIEEGRLEITCVWPDGIKIVADAVIAPDSNVFSLGWKVEGWTDDTFMGRGRQAIPVWFNLWRWQDPDYLEWAKERAALYRHDGWLNQAKRNPDITPLPAPTAFEKGDDACVEQGFYPDPLFTEGFRCRLTFFADPAKVGKPRMNPNNPRGDAYVSLMPSKAACEGGASGEIAVTVTTSRDTSLDAPKPKTHTEYVAAAKASAAEYWKSGLAFPQDKFLEDLWYATYHARRCVLRGGTVPPGLFLPSTVQDYSHWHGDYHANYNMQSIYWGDFTANRLEQADAYCDCVDFYIPIGRKIAKDYYNGRGVFIQLEGFPIKALDDYAGRLPLGRMAYMTGWFMTRYWEYYQFTRDKEWLRTRGYPFIRDCALFYLDFLRKAPHPDLPPELKDGKYHAFPSICGESGINDPLKLADGWQVMIHCRHSLWAAIQAAKILGVDEDLRRDWQDRLDNLTGQWGPDKKAAPYAQYCTYAMQPEHTRYISPYKYGEDDWDGKLNPRGAKSYDCWYIGIGTIWKYGVPRTNSCKPSKTYAEFRRTLAAWTHANGLVWGMAIANYGRSGAWSETLSVMSPFQEMMLQSWDGAVNVFPRWPKDKDAEFRNWRAQGAFIVSAEHKGGAIIRCDITSEKGEDCIMHGQWNVLDADGKEIATDTDEFGRLRFKTVAGGKYKLGFLSRKEAGEK